VVHQIVMVENVQSSRTFLVSAFPDEAGETGLTGDGTAESQYSGADPGWRQVRRRCSVTMRINPGVTPYGRVALITAVALREFLL
jgi:hypothetical protein